MKRFVATLLVAAAALTGGNAAHAQPLSDLIQKLEEGPDFRVRVQAALELGKTRGRASRLALEAGLDDENAAVRAASAAALKVMKDPQALVALKSHENDPSAAVRAQIKNSMEALRLAESGARSAAKPEVQVMLGKIRSAAATGTVLDDVARASRQKLGELPGVAVVEGGEPTATASPPPRKDVPVVMLTGRVKQLEQSRVGENVVYLASIEFVLHKMPGQTIKGVVSGSARASGSADEIGDAHAMADLRRSALEAAIESAIRRAPQALRAAAQ
jgi:hypothetical protein